MNDEEKIKAYIETNNDEIRKSILDTIPDNKKGEFFQNLFSRKEEQEKNRVELEKKIDDRSVDTLNRITERAIEKCDNKCVKAIKCFLNYFFKRFRIIVSRALGSNLYPALVPITEVTVDFILKMVHATLDLFVGAVFNADYWEAINSIAMQTWNDNEESGKLTQIYVTAKKVAVCFVYTFKQCIDKALSGAGAKLSEEEKNQLNEAIDRLAIAEMPPPTQESIEN